MTLKEIDQKSKDQKKVMKKDPKFFLQARNPKMRLNKWWKKLLEKYPFMGYGEHDYTLSIMGKDTGIKINSPRLIKKNLIKRRIKND